MEQSSLKGFKKMKKFNKFNGVMIIIALLFTPLSVTAQEKCRSTIGSHLKPVSKKIPLSWAIEFKAAPGIMTNPYLNSEERPESVSPDDYTILRGGSVFGALDFSFLKHHQIYLEGGYKNWTNSSFIAETHKGRHFGMKHFFYGFSNEKTAFKIGLQEARLGDFILIDERMLGITIDHTIDAFTVKLQGGTVLSNLARMGKFCANKHLYGVLNAGYTENIGKSLGETNLAGFIINWNPHYVKPDNDEFSEAGDEFSEELPEKKSYFSITNIGLMFYDEFGSSDFIPDHKFYTGLLFNIKLPYDLELQTSTIYQHMDQNNMLIYRALLKRSFIWGNGSNTQLSAGYIGDINIDHDPLFQPLFSNMFLGEVIRLDLVNLPLWYGSIKHRFPGDLKFYVALSAVGQLDDAETEEQDLEIGVTTLKKHLKLTLIGSRIKTTLLPKTFYMARLEMRFAF